MGAGTYDFPLRQGNTTIRTFAMQDANGDPVSVTGATFVFRAVFPKGSGVLRKTSEDAGLTVRAVDGEIDLTLTPAETRLLPVGALTTYDLEHRAGGVETTLAKGTITVIEGANDDA